MVPVNGLNLARAKPRPYLLVSPILFLIGYGCFKHCGICPATVYRSRPCEYLRSRAQHFSYGATHSGRGPIPEVQQLPFLGRGSRREPCAERKAKLALLLVVETNPREVLTRKEAAIISGISRNTLRARLGLIHIAGNKGRE